MVKTKIDLLTTTLLTELNSEAVTFLVKSVRQDLVLLRHAEMLLVSRPRGGFRS